jgi:hypothetical protein
MGHRIEGGGFILDKPDEIRFFQLLSIRGRLKIEVDTGMSSRFSSLQAAKRLYGVRSNTKRGALKELDALVESIQKQREAERNG